MAYFDPDANISDADTAAAVEGHSLWLDGGRSDDRPPFLGISFHKCTECLRRLLITRKKFIPEFDDSRSHRGIRRCFDGRCIKLADYVPEESDRVSSKLAARRGKVSEQLDRAPKGRDARDQFRPGPIVHLDHPRGSGRTIGN